MSSTDVLLGFDVEVDNLHQLSAGLGDMSNDRTQCSIIEPLSLRDSLVSAGQHI